MRYQPRDPGQTSRDLELWYHQWPYTEINRLSSLQSWGESNSEADVAAELREIVAAGWQKASTGMARQDKPGKSSSLTCSGPWCMMLYMRCLQSALSEARNLYSSEHQKKYSFNLVHPLHFTGTNNIIILNMLGSTIWMNQTKVGVGPVEVFCNHPEKGAVCHPSSFLISAFSCIPSWIFLSISF